MSVVDLGTRDWRTLAEREGTPLLVLDCDTLRRAWRELQSALPGVLHHYAIKAQPHPDVIRTLAACGAHFDLATNGEIELVEQLGVDARRTIHTHPIKRDADIRRALRFGCTTFVFDNPAELAKFVPYRHRVALLLRVAFSDPGAQVDLSRKFGCAEAEVETLLAEADRLGLHVKGLSFHVGSQASDGRAHAHAVERCARWLRAARPDAVAPLSVLDIGGGFPVSYDGAAVDLAAFCAPLREALAQLPAHVRVWSEPGRWLAAPAMTCIASVVGTAERDGRRWYYLDDGVYGSFSGRIFDHCNHPLIGVAHDPQRDPHATAAAPAVLAGPTCDGIDVVAEAAEVGQLELGDLVVAPMVGAYGSATATTFNSLPLTKVLTLNGESAAPRLLAAV